MPSSFLSASEQARLNRFPDQVPHEDLITFFTLSEKDRTAVAKQRGPTNRLGFALQLCALRYLGFAPDDLSTAPWDAVAFVAQQLTVAPEAIHAYGTRINTRTTHYQQVQVYLGFRTALPLDFHVLSAWLVDRALEHDKPTLLLQLACEKLRQEKIVRPGMTRLERLVATARQQAHEETFERLISLLTPERKTFLDELLTPDAATHRTRLSWLRQEATAHATPQIVETLKKIRFLQDAGAAQWPLTRLNPNRVKWLAQIGWRATNQQSG